MFGIFNRDLKTHQAQQEQKEKMHNASSAYLYNTGKPVWMDRSYTDFAKKAYTKNVIAHRCINIIADAAVSVKLQLYRRINDMRHPVFTHPLLTLLNKPNPVQSGKELLKSIYTYRQISGNAYLLGVVGNIKPLQIHELYALRPDHVQVIAGASFVPLGYRYQVNNECADYFINPESGRCEILHIKNFHPLSPHYGLSPIEAAAFSIDQHNQASEWNQALLQNAAKPSGAIIVKGTDGKASNLTQQQFESLKNDIAKQMSGAENAGRPLLLEGGLEWQQISLSPKDMDYIEAKNNAAREIALAFGVPPQLLGIPGDNKYSNLAEARIALWEETVIPLVENTTEHLNRWLVGHFEEERNEEQSDLELCYSTDNISVLAYKERSKRELIENSSIMTLEEKRQALGFSITEV